ncbi:MAG: hypothetical protein ABEI80_07555 [Haloplanus sp.]
MSDETLETIRTLLESLIEETDDSEVHYKLRTALQLLAVHEEEINRLEEAADSDADLETRLRDLGYLE